MGDDDGRSESVRPRALVLQEAGLSTGPSQYLLPAHHLAPHHPGPLPAIDAAPMKGQPLVLVRVVPECSPPSQVRSLALLHLAPSMFSAGWSCMHWATKLSFHPFMCMPRPCLPFPPEEAKIPPASQVANLRHRQCQGLCSGDGGHAALLQGEVRMTMEWGTPPKHQGAICAFRSRMA